MMRTRLELTGLRARLLLLICAALLPAIGLLLLQGVERRRDGEAAAEAQALALARVVAQTQDRRVEGARQLLIAFAAHSAVRENNPEACASEFRSLLDQYQGLYSDIGWADRSGRVICHAIEQRSTISIGDRDYFRRALLERRFVTSGLIRGKIRGTPILAFAAPFTDHGGQIAGVVFANLHVSAISASLREVRSPHDNTILTMLDRDGVIIARSADAERFVGTVSTAFSLPAINSSGELVSTLNDGTDLGRFSGITTVRDVFSQPVMYVAVGVARDTFVAASAARFRTDLLTILTFGLGALAAAWIGTEWLVRRPVNALLDVTSALGSGRLETRATEIPKTKELAALARSFNTMAEQLEERDVRLRQAQRLEAVGQLAGGIAHDFNNLLTVIIGYCHSLTEQIDEGSPAARELRELRHSAERAAALTQQLLAFSRRQQLSPKRLCLNDSVSGMVELLHRTIKADIALELDLQPDLPCVTADPTQIEQVILNLAINARDAMPDGGSIRITTRSTTHARANGAQVPSVELTVADTGVGMDPATRARIFEPFFTTKGKAGNGLGLATVYGIVKQSGGSITCDSAPGFGTQFTMVLPAIDAAPTEEASVEAEREPATDVAVV